MRPWYSVPVRAARKSEVCSRWWRKVRSLAAWLAPRRVRSALPGTCRHRHCAEDSESESESETHSDTGPSKEVLQWYCSRVYVGYCDTVHRYIKILVYATPENVLRAGKQWTSRSREPSQTQTSVDRTPDVATTVLLWTPRGSWWLLIVLRRQSRCWEKALVAFYVPLRKALAMEWRGLTWIWVVKLGRLEEYTSRGG